MQHIPEKPPVERHPILRPHATIWFEALPGNRRGEVVVEESGGLVMAFELSLTQYSLLFALAEQAHKDRDLPAWKSHRGFLTKEQLQQRIVHWGVKSPWYIIKHIFRTREKLSKAGPVGELSGWEWAHQILETSSLDAYRLSVEPERIVMP